MHKPGFFMNRVLCRTISIGCVEERQQLIPNYPAHKFVNRIWGQIRFQFNIEDLPEPCEQLTRSLLHHNRQEFESHAVEMENEFTPTAGCQTYPLVRAVLTFRSKTDDC